MLPAGVTLASALSDAATVVSEFDTMLTIIVGASAGMAITVFLAKQVKRLFPRR